MVRMVCSRWVHVRFREMPFVSAMVKAKHNRSAKDKRVLREQVRANRRLYRAMLLRDDFMDLYTYKTETWAKKFRRYVSTTLRHSRAAFSLD